jgi:hypothetical protein
MQKRHLPSIEALTSCDDERLTRELRLSEVREQVALARSLMDRVDRLVPPGDPLAPPPTTDGRRRSEISAQDDEAVAEELARLGCRIVELASAFTRARRAAPKAKRSGAELGMNG